MEELFKQIAWPVVVLVIIAVLTAISLLKGGGQLAAQSPQDKVKAFFGRLRDAAKNLWRGVKALPIIAPLYKLLYSRKAAITALSVTFLLEVLPRLVPVKFELEVVVGQAVGIVLVAIANILGIAAEDYATKSGQASLNALVR